MKWNTLKVTLNLFKFYQNIGNEFEYNFLNTSQCEKGLRIL